MRNIMTEHEARDTVSAIIRINEARNIAIFNGACAMDYVFLSGALAFLQRDLRLRHTQPEVE